MTKENSPNRTLIGLFSRHPRLMQALSLLGGLGVLGSGLVVAQTESPVDETAAAPAVEAAPEPAPPPAVKPQPAPPEAAIAPEAPVRQPEPAPVVSAVRQPVAPIAPPAPPVAKKPIPAPPVAKKPIPAPAPPVAQKPIPPAPPVARKPIPAPAPPVARKPIPPAPPVARKPVIQAPISEAPAPAPARETLRLAPPDLSAPEAPTVANSPERLPNPVPVETAEVPRVEPVNRYSDRANDSIGATNRYAEPAPVVLSNRSTGCQTTSQNGQLSGGVCGVVAPIPQTANSGRSIRQLQQDGIAAPKPRLDSVTAQKPRLDALIAQKPILDADTVIAQKPQLDVAIAREPQPQANTVIAQRPQPDAVAVQQPQRVASRTHREPQLDGVKRLPAPQVKGIQSVNYTPAKVVDSVFRASQQGMYSIPSSAAATGSSYYNLSNRPVGRPSFGKKSFMFPLTIPATISSVFGWRTHPISGDYRYHAGTDIGAPQGTPVIAAAPGQVGTADFLGGYGLSVVLFHEGGTQASLYAHLSELFVLPGDVVDQGTVIGRVGSTGNSTGPHLHFEWRHLTSEGWIPVDAGTHLEYSLSQFIHALHLEQPPAPRGY